MICLRPKLSMLFILAIMMLSAGLARAGDAAARHIIGFSPDGIYFAYEQFGTLDWSESNSGWSEINIIDTRTGRIVGDKPIMAVDTNPDGGLTLAEARKQVDKEAAPLIAKYAIGMPGELIASAKETVPDEMIAYDTIPTVEKASPKVLDADVDHLERWHFVLNETLVASESDCSDSFAKFGGDSVEKTDKGRGMSVTLSSPKGERIVYEDHFLPSSRNCPTSYSLSEAYLFRPNNEPPVIVVLVQFFSQGFEGPDRRFLAVAAHSR